MPRAGRGTDGGIDGSPPEKVVASRRRSSRTSRCPPGRLNDSSRYLACPPEARLPVLPERRGCERPARPTQFHARDKCGDGLAHRLRSLPGQVQRLRPCPLPHLLPEPPEVLRQRFLPRRRPSANPAFAHKRFLPAAERLCLRLADQVGDAAVARLGGLEQAVGEERQGEIPGRAELGGGTRTAGSLHSRAPSCRRCGRVGGSFVLGGPWCRPVQ